MSDVLVALLTAVAGYLLGTLPTAVVVSRSAGHDPTREGSGNPGASNVFRTAGRRAGALVLVGDMLKGAAAAGLGWVVAGHTVGVVCGAAAVLGHVAPVWRIRHGGKGVATLAGAVLVLFPVHGVVAVAGWVLVARVARRPSVASLLLAVALPASIAVTGAPGVELAILVGLTAVVVARHTANIARLLHGDERPLRAEQP
jgi:acyl phosphate:glycerol-3-phosphate acyltransferase